MFLIKGILQISAWVNVSWPDLQGSRLLKKNFAAAPVVTEILRWRIFVEYLRHLEYLGRGIYIVSVSVRTPYPRTCCLYLGELVIKACALLTVLLHF